MKAVIHTNYGPPEVLQLQEVEKPQPNDDQLLIKVFATTVTSGEVKIRSFKNIPKLFWLPARLNFGLFKPKNKMLGNEFSGVVESIGKNVKSFKPGDKVFGFYLFGANAEYFCVPEKAAVTTIPGNFTFEEAAAIPFGALNALFFLKAGKINKGDKVLVAGSSGAVGVYAVQLTKYFGADVTATCSTKNVELVKSLGADSVIDYTKEDVSKNGKVYDIIFDTVGATKYSHIKNSLTKNGKYILIVFAGKELLQMMWNSMFSSKKIICTVSSEKKEDIEFLSGLMQQGKLKPVIDKKYPLEKIVDAHTYVETGHKRGAVVINVV
ncbi:MAG: NAD(P)-dependent alcohol dehydrogenase [Ignavibacteriales bacterium]|nr:MAG: NAD(P)-dependent alcohol dehydrogenase [Ignavibacteriales bacterium]